MKTQNFVNKNVLIYTVAFMVLLFGVFVNESFGIGCTGPCERWEYLGGGLFGCVGCSSYCEEECIDSGICPSWMNPCCLLCGGDPTKSCCNGECYDVTTKKCCYDTGIPYLCDKNKNCCNGNCCDPTKCEECFLNAACLVCSGDPTSKCCDGVCLPKCQLVDGENCTGADGSCPGCAAGGTDCVWGWRPNAKHWKGGTEKICNPRGCPTDCADNVKVCYELVPCIRSNWPIPLLICVDVGIPPIPIPVYACQVGEGTCRFCVEDDNPEHISKRWVQNDTCSE